VRLVIIVCIFAAIRKDGKDQEVQMVAQALSRQGIRPEHSSSIDYNGSCIFTTQSAFYRDIMKKAGCEAGFLFSPEK